MKKKETHLKDIENWIVNYYTYEDILRVFDSRFYTKKYGESIKINYKTFDIIYIKPSLEPIVFEMKEASKSLGNIDNMDKKHIIQGVERLVENHG